MENIPDSLTKVIDSPSEYLYCYKSERSSINIIENKSLMFSSLGKLNDPIENTLQTFFLDLDTRFTQSEVKEYSDLLKSFTKKYCNEYVKVLCFTQSKKPDERSLISQSHIGYMRFSMWSQYAENGKGVCFIFNRRELDKEFEVLIKSENIFGKSGTVIYTEDYVHNMAFRFMYDEVKSLKIGHNILKPKIEKYFRQYFFKKRVDWSNELEYRYLIVSDRIMNLGIQKSLCGIIFGYNASNELITRISLAKEFDGIPKASIQLQGYHAYIKGI